MKLSNEDIAEVINKMGDCFESANVPRKDKMRLSLLVEEALLRFQEKFGEEQQFTVIIKKWLGMPKVFIRLKGRAYNPLEDDDENQIFSEEMIQNLLDYEKAQVLYRYVRGTNEIIVLTTKEKKGFRIPGGSVTIAILLAFLVGFLCNQLPQSAREGIVTNAVTPVLQTLLGALVAINMPMIFISVVASICAIENITMLDEIGSRILVRFFAIMFFIAFLSIFVCSLFFPVIDFNLSGGVSVEDLLEFKVIFELLLSIVPQNLVEPFSNGNIMQIVFMALLTGISMTILGDRVAKLKDLVNDMKYLIFKLVDIFFKVIPVIIFLCLLKTILIDSTDEILSVWKIVASEYVLYFGTMIIMLAMIAIRYKVKIMDFLKKISPAFLISFTTGSGSASMPKNMEICKNELKIDETLCNFYIPLSHSIFQTSKIIGVVACVFFGAEFSNATISAAQIIIIAFLAVQFSIASVSGNGGMVATMSLLFTQLNFSLDALGAITIADIFVVNFSGVVMLVVRDCDLLDLSHKVKLSAGK